ncbi:hypothetical protein AEGHOMDF_5887 [Methylobacterium soli]|nr:hypothetical protein AEGHOMDF_5887 [Methylobacterium soli]
MADPGHVVGREVIGRLLRTLDGVGVDPVRAHAGGDQRAMTVEPVTLWVQPHDATNSSRSFGLRSNGITFLPKARFCL